ncbi:transporter substrate-binding domain-containing protein [uncultured Pseudodesulfovibrio sp.]|uniref:substrate-binding periplasmic protein n=1 Tax=uncultured Pseudodesulfovibrio sp. TaxID=2035858 RepID=UPI0029C73ED3|nr:transporter substrate-binding domain-containing protein [uncultured Pseudodesulfovibrio sp.]
MKWERLLRGSLVLVCVLCAATAFGMEKVSLTSGEWPPYYSQSLPHGGVANQIITESFAQVGMTVDYVFLPWKRALDATMVGATVGSSGWLRTAEKEKDFLYSASIFESMRVLFYRRDRKFDWNEPQDLKDLRVAVALGSVSEIPLDSIFDQGKGKIDVAKSYASGMRKLAAGRVDVYICNLAVGLYLLRKQIPREEALLITYHPKPFMVEENHLIISRQAKGGQEIMDAFNQGLRQLRKSGRYDQIFDEYFQFDAVR